MKETNRVPEDVRSWVSSIDKRLDRVDILSGGINNPTYRFSGSSSSLVVKSFTGSSVTKHERYQAEVGFLSLANFIMVFT